MQEKLHLIQMTPQEHVPSDYQILFFLGFSTYFLLQSACTFHLQFCFLDASTSLQPVVQHEMTRIKKIQQKQNPKTKKEKVQEAALTFAITQGSGINHAEFEKNLD